LSTVPLKSTPLSFAAFFNCINFKSGSPVRGRLYVAIATQPKMDLPGYLTSAHPSLEPYLIQSTFALSLVGGER